MSMHFGRIVPVEDLTGRKHRLSSCILPSHGLATTRQHDAWPVLRAARLGLNRRSEVHEHCDRADYAVRVIHQTDHLSQIRLSDEIDDAAKRRMIVAVAVTAALYEKDSILKVVYNLLISDRVPPLCCKVVLAPGNYYPVSRVGHRRIFVNLRLPKALEVVQMDVDLKGCWLYSDVKPSA